MLAGKQHIGYMGDMPAIVSTTKQDVADIRIVATLGLGKDKCNIFLVRTDAPQFQGLQGSHQVARRQAGRGAEGQLHRPLRAGRCSARRSVQPAAYLNQNIEVITSNFSAGKLDAAVMWEPTASSWSRRVWRAASPPARAWTRTTARS